MSRAPDERGRLEQEVVERIDPDAVSQPLLLRRMAVNTAVQAAGAILAAAIGLATFIAITRGLGPTAFGDLITASVFLFVPVALADFAFAGVLREITERPERTEYVMRTSLPLRALVAAALLTVATAIGLLLPFTDQAKLAILISLPGAFFTLLHLAFVPVLQAQLRMHWSVLASLAGRVVTLALTLVALAAGLGFEGVVAAASVGALVTFVLALEIVRRIVSVRPVVDVAYWRTLLHGSFALGLSGALGLIYFRIDTLLLAGLRPPHEVGLYSAAYKFIELTETVASFASNSVFPTMSRMASRFDSRTQALVQRAVDLLVVMGAPLSVLMVVFPTAIITVTAGEDFSAGGPALQILAAYLIPAFVSGLLWRALIASRQDRLLLAFSTAILTLNVALNVVLIPTYGFKAAAATSVASQIVATAIIVVAVRRTYGFWPHARYGVVVSAGVIAMVAVLLTVPGPTLLVALLALAAYATVVTALPGAARQTLVELTGLGRRRVRAATVDAAARELR